MRLMAPWYCSQPHEMLGANSRSASLGVSLAHQTRRTRRFRKQPFHLCDSPREIRRLDRAQLQVQERRQAGGNPRMNPFSIHIRNQPSDCISHCERIVQGRQRVSLALHKTFLCSPTRRCRAFLAGREAHRGSSVLHSEGDVEAGLVPPRFSL